MPRRARIRRLRGLGQASSPSWWNWLTSPIATYNVGVVQRERQANPSNAPTANAADLNQALATAQANGVDPGVIQALWIAGANSVQLQIAASSPEQAQAALAPGGALQSITGVTPPAGQPVSSALLYPQAAQPQYMNYGVLTPAQISTVVEAGAAAGDALTWLGNNWPWLALGAIGVWWLSREL